ncbi:MAG: hypothetical protein QF546_13625 [Alphaproteobacteria bacterium]|jgi:hypothetical protein|nr:hypothetical protein [Alphaproteobacteria bacterium]
MQNTNDWQTTLAGLALVGKALAEDGDEGHQAAILEHIQGALQEGFDGVTVEVAEGMFIAASTMNARRNPGMGTGFLSGHCSADRPASRRRTLQPVM